MLQHDMCNNFSKNKSAIIGSENTTKSLHLLQKNQPARKKHSFLKNVTSKVKQSNCICRSNEKKKEINLKNPPYCADFQVENSDRLFTRKLTPAVPIEFYDKSIHSNINLLSLNALNGESKNITSNWFKSAKDKVKFHKKSSLKCQTKKLNLFENNNKLPWIVTSKVKYVTESLEGMKNICASKVSLFTTTSDLAIKKKQYLNKNTNVIGQKMNLISGDLRFFEMPDPPKLSVSPSTVKNKPAIDYQSNFVEEFVKVADSSKDIGANIKHSSTDPKFIHRLLNRRYNSTLLDSKGYLQYNDVQSTEKKIEIANEKVGNKVWKYESILNLQRKHRMFCGDSVVKKLSFQHLRCFSHPALSTIKHLSNVLSFDSIMAEQLEERKLIQTNFQKFKNGGSKEINQVNIKSAVKHHHSSVTNFKRTSRSESDISKIKRVLNRNIYLTNLHFEEDFSYRLVEETYSVKEIDIQSRRSLSDESILTVGCLKKSYSKQSEKIAKEIKDLSLKLKVLPDSNGLVGFLLCRRGALHRRLGNFSDALFDLDRAEMLEPRLLDIYWQRHLLFLVQGETEKALKDLQQVITYNKNHMYAHWSRATIYKEQGEILQAISSFNQAIFCNPFIARLYNARAELFEQHNDLPLALEDYKKAHNLQPSDLFAVLKIAMCHFRLGLWAAATNYFTEVLHLNPKYHQAYFYRGIANAKLNYFEEAVSDLSTCLHLSPNHYAAFYYRGCMLQRCSKTQAIKDLSISLLINSKKENILAFIQRGVIYASTKKFHQALFDLKSALQLNSGYAPVHLNLGLIDMNYNKNAVQALRRFSFAFMKDPTFIQALICRAKTFILLNNIDAAILDYTRAIHINPLCKKFKIARGYLLLKKGYFNHAISHIQQCGLINSEDALPYEQAVIEIYLGNFKKAENILEAALANGLTAQLLMLMGKNKVRENKLFPAITCYEKILDILKPFKSSSNCFKESSLVSQLSSSLVSQLSTSLVYLNLGLCQILLNDYKKAFRFLNYAVKADRSLAEVYYWRGLVKMKLGLSSPVSDFRHSLTLKPSFYQTHFCCALYYGLNKRYTKAIMSCNKALRLKTQSIAILIYRGAMKFHIKAYSLAIKDLSQAIKLDQTCFLAYFNRAVCFHIKKFYFKALKDYSIVLLSDSSYRIKAFLNRGVLYFEIGDFQNALHDFSSLLEANPRNTMVLHSIGLCYHKLHYHDASKNFYTRTLQVDSLCCPALIGRANVLMEYNNFEAYMLGRRDYSYALFINPNSLEAILRLGRCLQIKGQLMKAWYLFTRALEIDSSCIFALEGRALVSLKMSNTFEAFSDLNHALKLKKTPELLTNRGIVNMASRDNVNAMLDYKMAIQLNHSFGTAHFNAANMCFLKNLFFQALAYYDSAITWNPNDKIAFISRGVCKIAVNDMEDAMRDFNQAIAMKPNLSFAYYNRGRLFQLTQKYKEAENDYTKALEIQPGDVLLYKRRVEVRGKLGDKEPSMKDYYAAVVLQTSNK